MYVKEKSTLPNYLYDIEGVENEADYNVEGLLEKGIFNRN